MIALKVNGKVRDLDIEPDTPLLYVLRNDLALNGAKFGCGLGQCGACTVLIDGQPTFSCVVPVSLLQNREVTTVEGLRAIASPGVRELTTVEGLETTSPGALQKAFIEEQAAQCGYCIAGMIVRAQALLTANRDPSDDDIRRYMQPNLCRCGTHTRIVKAIKRAAQTMRTAAAAEAGRG